MMVLDNGIAMYFNTRSKVKTMSLTQCFGLLTISYHFIPHECGDARFITNPIFNRYKLNNHKPVCQLLYLLETKMTSTWEDKYHYAPIGYMDGMTGNQNYNGYVIIALM